MDNSITIALGGQKFVVSALSLGDIEALDIARAVEDGLGPQGVTKAHYARCIAVISTALRAAGHSEMTPDALRKLEIKTKQMTEAAIAILRFSELIPAKEPEAGELEAVAEGSGVVSGPGARAA